MTKMENVGNMNSGTAHEPANGGRSRGSAVEEGSR
jgi:hypothetical protein